VVVSTNMLKKGGGGGGGGDNIHLNPIELLC
jgi:hypothetical protein